MKMKIPQGRGFSRAQAVSLFKKDLRQILALFMKSISWPFLAILRLHSSYFMHQFMVKMGHLFKKASRPFLAPYN